MFLVLKRNVKTGNMSMQCHQWEIGYDNTFFRAITMIHDEIFNRIRAFFLIVKIKLNSADIHPIYITDINVAAVNKMGSQTRKTFRQFFFGRRPLKVSQNLI